MGLDKKGPITLSIALEEIAAVLQDGARSAAIAMREMNRVMFREPAGEHLDFLKDGLAPPGEVAEIIARSMTRRIDAALFAGRLPDPGLEIATGYTDPAGWEEEGPSLSFEDLVATVEEMLPKEPVPTAIWFVDRPHDYWRFMTLAAPPIEEPDIYQRLMGLPVIRWERYLFDPENEIIASRDDDHLELVQANEDKKVWPWVCNHPGIWARMSDGRWQRIEIVTGGGDE